MKIFAPLKICNFFFFLGVRMDVGIAVASWLSLFICSLLVMNIARVQSDRLVDISFLESAISKGAGSISPRLFLDIRNH